MYATPDDVKAVITVTEADLGLTTEQFDARIKKLLSWAEAEINTYLNHSYTEEELAADDTLRLALESAAVRVVENWLLDQAQKRAAPVIKVDDFTVKQPKREILTDDIRQTLAPYVCYGEIEIGAV
jgi:hypothetical protein